MMWIPIYLLILASMVAAIRFAQQRARRLGADPLVAIRRKVAAERRLARKNPARFAPDLALSLATLSQTFRKAGDRAGALKARREATEINRRLARKDPAKFEPLLATDLFALAPLLTGAGDRAGALLADQQGTEIFRRLAASDPAQFEPSLANSLSNLSSTLGEVGDRGGAVTASGRRSRSVDASPAQIRPGSSLTSPNTTCPIYRATCTRSATVTAPWPRSARRSRFTGDSCRRIRRGSKPIWRRASPVCRIT
jgi:hypothetical protein